MRFSPKQIVGAVLVLVLVLLIALGRMIAAGM